MTFTLHEENYKDCKITILPDPDAESPREWSNIGTMVCWHKRYTLGDEQTQEDPQNYLESLVPEAIFNPLKKRILRAETHRQCPYKNPSGRLSPEDYYAILDKVEDRKKILAEKWIETHLVVLPLYLYDHSGITIDTGGFSCPWDSGQVGFIYAQISEAQKEWPNLKKEALRKTLTAALEKEVSTYASYLEGDVAGWVAETNEGEDIGSCWGYYPKDSKGYGDRWDYALAEAKASVDAYLQNETQPAS